MKLSVVIPVYNERATLETILRRIQSTGLDTEIIIVDDGSTDGTRELLCEWQTTQQGCVKPVRHDLTSNHAEQPGDWEKTIVAQRLRLDNVQVFFQDRNMGKGAALRRGFQAASGDVIVVQDADLEYDPYDWFEMLRLVEGGWADIVFGSRFYGNSHRALYWHHYMGNKLISNLVNILCDISLSDIEVCYKMFHREVLNSLKLATNDFGFEVEFTVKVAKQKRWRIYEIGWTPLSRHNLVQK